ncbi:MAG: hypothetical protein F6K54_08200 [Okeania sp. SIO3B5]|uniref:NACHT C-terminal helical domain 2-containing protein n=1 Tax=Okeania sp. SIO3B5 TaxID=2607811 RepID=UPI0013FF2218|nr:hypothetical protein [Okeania sp. SIO3B5]NEO53067.1 hypothetical protein [Okeania sp. SIO3B5]
MIDKELYDSDFMIDKELYDLLSYENVLYFYPHTMLENKIDSIMENKIELEFKRELQKLKSELPQSNQPKENFRASWRRKRPVWSDKLRNLIIKYRNICHDWQLNNYDFLVLKEYYHANVLLLNCLNSDCYVSREVRQEIEDTLLLPTTEIQKRKTASL